MLAVLTRASLPLGVGLFALARGGTAAVALARFGPTPFGIVFAVEAVALAAAAFVLARAPAPRGRRALAAGLAATALLQIVPFSLGLRRGFTFLSLGDVVFIGGLLGAAWATLQASTEARAHAPALGAAAHLGVAAVGPVLWTVTNATMGRFDFMLTSALALAGVALTAWTLARDRRREAGAAPPPGVGA